MLGLQGTRFACNPGGIFLATVAVTAKTKGYGRIVSETAGIACKARGWGTKVSLRNPGVAVFLRLCRKNTATPELLPRERKNICHTQNENENETMKRSDRL